jgi:phosphinothricin acetyltransferase
MTDGATLRTRAATIADAAAIAEIYNQGIVDRVATFEIEPRAAAQIEEWLSGRGAGRAVLAALIEAAAAEGMHKLTSRVFPENTASRALLKGLGFEEIGVHRRHGQLDGRWRDCVLVERLLGTGAVE